MDFYINWPDAIVAGIIAYGTLRAEIAYRRWYWAKKARMAMLREKLATKPVVNIMGEIRGAAKAVICSHCKEPARDYIIYNDGTIRHFSCTIE